MRTKAVRFISIICTVCIFFGTMVSASAAFPSDEELSPQASAYLTSYTAWAARASDNRIFVYYDVTGNGTQPYLGAKLIVVEVNDSGKWTPVATYTGTVSNGMLVKNRADHGGNIVYQGNSSSQYRAVITIFGGTSTTTGDSRIITTDPV